MTASRTGCPWWRRRPSSWSRLRPLAVDRVGQAGQLADSADAALGDDVDEAHPAGVLPVEQPAALRSGEQLGLRHAEQVRVLLSVSSSSSVMVPTRFPTLMFRYAQITHIGLSRRCRNKRVRLRVGWLI
jgi:hypothetical protein